MILFEAFAILLMLVAIVRLYMGIKMIADTWSANDGLQACGVVYAKTRFAEAICISAIGLLFWFIAN